MLSLFVAVALFLAVAESHMCLLNPYQRGGLINSTYFGNPDCGLETAPCGGTNSDERVRYFIVEDTAWYFVMQKNLDHYTSSSPGNFTINLLDNDDKFVATIGSVSDTSDPAGTIYQVNEKTPTGLNSGDSYSIQAIYYSNAGLTFYQCADIVVLG